MEIPEQNQQSDPSQTDSEESLFDWAEHHPEQTKEYKNHVEEPKKSQTEEGSQDDGLGWNCPQCELLGHPCSRHQ